MVHPEAKVLSTCKPLKTDKLLFPKYSEGTNIYWTFPVQKGEVGRKKEVTGPKQVQNIAKQIPSDLNNHKQSSLVRFSAF